jgi:hypothetical protein
MGALRLEPFTPADALPPLRLNGEVDPARLTTTDEQRAEALQHAADELTRAHATEGVLEVRWSRHEPTVLTVTGHFEQLPTPRGTVAVFLPDRVTEATRAGVPIEHSESVRLRTLRQELADMHRQDAGPA